MQLSKISLEKLKEYSIKKVCVICYEDTDLTSIYKNINIALCKKHKEQFEREKETKLKWRKNNAQKIKETRLKWRKNNREKMKTINQKWLLENPEKARMAAKKWRENNKEHKKQYDMNYHKEHRLEMTEYTKKWYKEHPKTLRNNNEKINANYSKVYISKSSKERLLQLKTEKNETYSTLLNKLINKFDTNEKITKFERVNPYDRAFISIKKETLIRLKTLKKNCTYNDLIKSLLKKE